MKSLLLGIFLLFIVQSIVWFQINGQFIWDWFKKNPYIVSLLGILISFLYIKSTELIVGYYDGLVWPARFIGFSVGVIVFSLFTYKFIGEGINLKTALCLFLAFIIICIQLFWKSK